MGEFITGVYVMDLDWKEIGKQLIIVACVGAVTGMLSWIKAVDKMEAELQIVNSRMDAQDKRIDAMVLQQELWNGRLLELTNKVIIVETAVKFMAEDTTEIKDDIKTLLKRGEQ